MVIPSTAAPRRPLKRSTMPLVSCRWSAVCGGGGDATRRRGRRKPWKAGVKHLPLSVSTGVRRKQAAAASRGKAMALFSVSSSLTARWTERERRSRATCRGRRGENACAARRRWSAAWASACCRWGGSRGHRRGPCPGPWRGSPAAGRIPPQGASPRTLFLARLPWQPVWPGGAVEAIRSTALAPLAHGLGADAVAPGKHA